MFRPGSCGIALALAFLVAVSAVRLAGQQSAPAPPSGTASPIATQRALLDNYCVTCHDDHVKTANLSLQNSDLSKVGEQAELWEKVVRKLRAGVMPPPDVPRPSLAEYDGLRDWLDPHMRNRR